MAATFETRFRDFQKQYGDPILTALTVLLLVLLFVVAPLLATGHIVFQVFGFLLALAIIAGAVFLSGSTAAFIAMSVAFGMNITAALHRLSSPSALDIHLVAGAWLILAITLGWVVARQVFAAGRVTYHRIIGAILLYFLISLIFVALFAIVGQANPEGVFRHCDRRQHGARQQPDLFQLRDADLNRLRRCGAGASDRTQPLQSGIHHWSALSRNFARAAGHAGNRGYETRAKTKTGQSAMIDMDRLQRSWLILTFAALAVIVLAAGVFIVETMPPGPS